MVAVSVLAVSSSEEDRVLLGHVFSHSNWKFEHVRTCGEARKLLSSAEVGVVLCGTELSDGNWRDLLQDVGRQPVPPRLIVVSSLADDRLWGEVLDLGGYDVLGKPFDPSEVIRVVSLAWRQWKHDSGLVDRAVTE